MTLLAYDLINHWRDGEEDLRSQAALLASTTLPALAFDDPVALHDALAAMRQRQQVRVAAVYRADGTLFVGTTAAGETLPERLDQARPPGKDSLSLRLPVAHAGEQLGEVYLVTRLGLAERLRDTGLLMLAVGLPSFMVAAALFGRLRQRLLRRLLDVAHAADKVARDRDFGVRSPPSGLAEVDVLVGAFNDMLGTLQQEIQERQRAEDALKADDRRKDKFLATLAHELRNPLAPIRNAARGLRNAQVTVDQREHSSAVIERQVRHMALLLDDLLDISRITRGKLVLRPEPTPLASIVALAVETANPLIDARRHRLQVTLPEPSPVLEVDSLRLAQVLSNLLANAAKFTDPGGDIQLLAREHPDGLDVEVLDNGMGIAPESLEQVFAMFGQGQGSERAGGLGIGLALSRALAELHGGRLQACSEGAGRGTRMLLTLPAALIQTSGIDNAAAPGTDAPLEAGPAIVAAPQGLRVLVADDNRDAADSLQALLELDGHQVQVAYDGATALERWQDFAPQVALLDIGMPRLTGDRVARHIRSAGDGAVLLVALSGWGQESDKASAREAGFDEHLTKPIDPQQLSKLLQAHAAGMTA